MQGVFTGYIVVSNRVLRDADGVSRGVGFARLVSNPSHYPASDHLTIADSSLERFVMRLSRVSMECQ